MTTAIAKPTASDYAHHHLDVARQYLGENRSNNRPQIARFLALFDLAFADEHGKPYAFCAAGIGWSAVKGYCDLNHIAYTSDNAPHVFAQHRDEVSHAYAPLSASCEEVRQAAIKRGMYLPVQERKHALPGWFVLYSWDGKDEAHHIGLLEKDNGEELIVIEFNTSSESDGNGGAVERKTRPLTHVLGFVTTWHDVVPAPPKKPVLASK